MAFLLINITLVRDLKLKSIVKNYTSEKMLDYNNTFSDHLVNDFGFMESECLEGNEEEKSEKEKESENEVEDTDLFFTTNSNNAISILKFSTCYRYISFLPIKFHKNSTPPPRVI